jgi:hypothetical protein
MVDDRGMSAPLRMARYSRLLDMAQRPDKTGGTMVIPSPRLAVLHWVRPKEMGLDRLQVSLNVALTIRYAPPPPPNKPVEVGIGPKG